MAKTYGKMKLCMETVYAIQLRKTKEPHEKKIVRKRGRIINKTVVIFLFFLNYQMYKKSKQLSTIFFG